MAMETKMRERMEEEEKLRTSTAIRLPRHPLPYLYFNMGYKNFAGEAVARGGRRVCYYWQQQLLPWKAMGAASTILRASTTASHERAAAASMSPLPLLLLLSPLIHPVLHHLQCITTYGVTPPAHLPCITTLSHWHYQLLLS